MSTPQASRPVTVRYANPSEVQTGTEGARVRLALDDSRGVIGLRGRVKAPGFFRDAVMTAVTILTSDLRHKTRDRTAYLAYLAKQGKKSTAATWEAQKAFLDQSLEQDEKKSTVLEPLLTVHPDEVSLEVFSQDESSYARLALDSALFDQREAAHGTTFVSLSDKFTDALSRMRTWAPVQFETGTSFVGTAPAPETKTSEVPWQWIRGFLQVQSAANLPAATCELAPIDLYNVLFALRTRKAKKSPRALRFELVPGAPPRIVLEPWEIVLEGHGPVYKGGSPRVIRTFGRQRLMALARVLPYVKGVRVKLLGAGLPVFWVLDLGVGSLTVALTGWTESGWSSAASFDALTPPREAAELAGSLYARLQAQGPMSLDALVKAAGGASVADVRAALQLECLRGRVIDDLARNVYRPRELFAEPVSEASIRYGSEREERAHRLLGDGVNAASGEVRITKLHEIVGEGVEIQGEVIDREAHRSFSPSFTIDLEGRAVNATCGCPTFRRSGMREGPCEHMIALRLAFARRRAEEERQRQTPEGRKLIRAETRTFVRRDASGRETLYRLSLDNRVVRVRWGARNEEGREQRLWFDSDRDAREAYFARMEELGREGFIDAESAFA